MYNSVNGTFSLPPLGRRQLGVSLAAHTENASARQRELAAELLRQSAQGIHLGTGFLQGGFLAADTR